MEPASARMPAKHVPAGASEPWPRAARSWDSDRNRALPKRSNQEGSPCSTIRGTSIAVSAIVTPINTATCRRGFRLCAADRAARHRGHHRRADRVRADHQPADREQRSGGDAERAGPGADADCAAEDHGAVAVRLCARQPCRSDMTRPRLGGAALLFGARPLPGTRSSGEAAISLDRSPCCEYPCLRTFRPAIPALQSAVRMFYI